MLKKKYLPIYTIAIILIALIFVGSFWDYEIANAVYIGELFSENPFGIIFAFIGIIPTFVGWAFIGAGILPLIKSGNIEKRKTRWLIALSVLLFVLSFFYFCNTLMMVNENAFSVPWWVAYPIGILIILAAAYAGYKLSLKSENESLLRTLVFLAILSLVTMIIIMSSKEIMNRPRFRFVLASGNSDYFINWWQNGAEIKENASANAVSDEFSSFPSGHSAYSMFAIFIFPSLADFLPKLEKYKPLLFLLGFAWWALTAISRLSVGAHYLTDVCFAGMITLLAYAACATVKRIINRRKTENLNGN